MQEHDRISRMRGRKSTMKGTDEGMSDERRFTNVQGVKRKIGCDICILKFIHFIHFIYIKLDDTIAILKDILIERGVANPLSITRISMNILIKAKSFKTKANVRRCSIIYVRTRLYKYDLLIQTYTTGEKHIFK